jgi:hypothetical protein
MYVEGAWSPWVLFAIKEALTPSSMNFFRHPISPRVQKSKVFTPSHFITSSGLRVYSMPSDNTTKKVAGTSSETEGAKNGIEKERIVDIVGIFSVTGSDQVTKTESATNNEAGDGGTKKNHE